MSSLESTTVWEAQAHGGKSPAWNLTWVQDPTQFVPLAGAPLGVFYLLEAHLLSTTGQDHIFTTLFHWNGLGNPGYKVPLCHVATVGLQTNHLLAGASVKPPFKWDHSPDPWAVGWGGYDTVDGRLWPEPQHRCRPVRRGVGETCLGCWDPAPAFAALSLPMTLLLGTEG